MPPLRTSLRALKLGVRVGCKIHAADLALSQSTSSPTVEQNRHGTASARAMQHSVQKLSRVCAQQTMAEAELSSSSEWLPLTADEQNRFFAEQDKAKRKQRLLTVRALEKEAAAGTRH